MAKKKTKSKRKMTVPITMGVPLAIDAAFMWSQLKNGQFTEAEREYVSYYFTGVNKAGQLDTSRLFMTYGKYAAGYLIHKYLAKPVNKQLGAMKVPVVRL